MGFVSGSVVVWAGFLCFLLGIGSTWDRGFLVFREKEKGGESGCTDGSCHKVTARNRTKPRAVSRAVFAFRSGTRRGSSWCPACCGAVARASGLASCLQLLGSDLIAFSV